MAPGTNSQPRNVAPPSTANLATSTPAPTTTYNGVVTWALYRETNSLDPIFAFDYPENTVIAAMCDTLLRQSPTGVVGSDTQAAIQKFEKARKLPVTGQVSDRLVRELAATIGHSIE